MIKKQSRQKAREKRHYRLRNRLSGTTAKPRLCVYRSNKHIYAQIIDDTVSKTIVSASTVEPAVAEGLKTTWDVEAAKAVGTAIAKKALDKGIDTIVFDRGGYIYHGRVAAVAESAREVGLKF